MTSRFLATLALLGVTACNSSSAPELCLRRLHASEIEPCNGQVGVTVSDGTAPTISWSPECGISSLVVSSLPTQQGGGGRVVWAFEVSEQFPIASGIRYGTNLCGANVWRKPEPLVAGNTYKVSVMYTVGRDGLVARGEATFSR